MALAPAGLPRWAITAARNCGPRWAPPSAAPTAATSWDTVQASVGTREAILRMTHRPDPDSDSGCQWHSSRVDELTCAVGRRPGPPTQATPLRRAPQRCAHLHVPRHPEPHAWRAQRATLILVRIRSVTLRALKMVGSLRESPKGIQPPATRPNARPVAPTVTVLARAPSGLTLQPTRAVPWLYPASRYRSPSEARADPGHLAAQSHGCHHCGRVALCSVPAPL